MSLKNALAAFVLVAGSATFAWADVDSQLFTVNVPVTIDVSAPAAATATKADDDNDVVFPDQRWTVVANDIDGSSITFEAPPFLTTQTGPKTANRNTKLDLAIFSQIGYSGATNLWSVTTATDTTDYLTDVNDKATVTAASTDAANVIFSLDVTFISGVHGTFASGTYTTTVTGTIAAL